MRVRELHRGSALVHVPHIHDRQIARYGCTSVVEAVDEGEVFTRDGIPNGESIAAIRALHPGKTLVYLDA